MIKFHKISELNQSLVLQTIQNRVLFIKLVIAVFIFFLVLVDWLVDRHTKFHKIPEHSQSLVFKHLKIELASTAG